MQHPCFTPSRSLGRTVRAGLAGALLGLFLFGTVMETGCGSPEEPPKKKKKKKSPAYRDVLPEIEDEKEKEKEKEEPTVDSRDEERRVREAWEARQKAQREQEKADAEVRKKAEEEKRRREKEAAAAEARAEEERKKREAETARRKEAEAKYLEEEIRNLAVLERELADLTSKLEFREAVDRLKAFHKDLKAQGAKDLCWERIDDHLAMMNVFEKMVSKLEPGTTLKLGRNFSFVVEKADLEGVTGKVGQARTTLQWTKIDKTVILSQFEWEDMEADDEFGTALLAYAFGLVEEAERHLLLCVMMDKSRVAKASALVASRRNLGKETVFLPYKGMWVTEEEKKYIDAGKEKYKGKWLTTEEIMEAKGFIKHEGQWLTKEEYEEATKAARKLAKLKAKLAIKGLIDKKGADEENLEWSEKRVFKSPWGNYTIHSNLTMDAIKDIAYMMEWLQWNFRGIFKIRRKMPKYIVSIAKNKKEYDGCLGGGGLGKCGGGAISTFYQPPNTTMVLMHEGTHQMVFKFAPCAPTWIHEAFASYFECSKFVVNPKTKTVDLKTGLLNKWRLGHIQREMKTNAHTPLRQQIKGNIGGLKMYHQGWALSYYLIKGNDGKYAPRYFYYLEKYAGKGGTGRKKGQPEDKQVMRFMKALGIHDLDAFEKDWIKFTLALDLKKGEDFNSGHQ